MILNRTLLVVLVIVCGSLSGMAQEADTYTATQSYPVVYVNISHLQNLYVSMGATSGYGDTSGYCSYEGGGYTAFMEMDDAADPPDPQVFDPVDDIDTVVLQVINGSWTGAFYKVRVPRLMED